MEMEWNQFGEFEKEAMKSCCRGGSTHLQGGKKNHFQEIPCKYNQGKRVREEEEALELKRGQPRKAKDSNDISLQGPMKKKKKTRSPNLCFQS
ncbi:hypothetical protein Csa_016051 [Cucumis sativus]|uniref:Uncharacterized protein n=1 Tax=Cucumis sativus TaxID=3659 RepID=A0A0A0K5B6_CUCSA|nr:hypothetical protein Csa_016051 [Cucumis sativus]